LLHPAPVNWAEFSPDGRAVLVSCFDNSAYLWEAASGRLITNLLVGADKPLPPGQLNQILVAHFSPDGPKIVAASSNGVARIWASHTLHESAMALRHSGAILSASFSPDSHWIITASGNCTGQIWDAATGKPVGKPLQHGGDVVSARFSPEGLRAVTASFD